MLTVGVSLPHVLTPHMYNAHSGGSGSAGDSLNVLVSRQTRFRFKLYPGRFWRTLRTLISSFFAQLCKASGPFKRLRRRLKRKNIAIAPPPVRDFRTYWDGPQLTLQEAETMRMVRADAAELDSAMEELKVKFAPYDTIHEETHQKEFEWSRQVSEWSCGVSSQATQPSSGQPTQPSPGPTPSPDPADSGSSPDPVSSADPVDAVGVAPRELQEEDFLKEVTWHEVPVGKEVGLYVPRRHDLGLVKTSANTLGSILERHLALKRADQPRAHNQDSSDTTKATPLVDALDPDEADNLLRESEAVEANKRAQAEEKERKRRERANKACSAGDAKSLLRDSFERRKRDAFLKVDMALPFSPHNECADS